MRRLVNTRGETENNHFERTRVQPPSIGNPVPNGGQAEKEFILYVKPNDKNSEMAYELAVPLFDIVHIQDIKRLETIPQFLRGVPTLVHVKKKTAYPGKLCLDHLDQLLGDFTKTLRDLGDTVVPADPFCAGSCGLDPQGIDCGVMDNYASCEMTSSDSNLYQTGRRKKEDIDGVINKLLEERTTIEKPRGEPTAAEMTKIIASMQEN